MINDEARRNDKIRMTTRRFYTATLSFEHSSLLRHSSFVVRHYFPQLRLQFARKEWIVLFLFADRRHWAVSGANDGFVG
jgi:hypothetical protein